jgi:hypothetical protein
MRKADIGAAIDSLGSDVRALVLDLVRQYRANAGAPYAIAVLKQAVDTPHRVQQQVAAWMAAYETRAGAGTAQPYLASCLTAAGSSKTLGAVNADINTLAMQAQALVNHVKNDGWTWDQVASAVEAQFAAPWEPELDYRKLPIPENYRTVWDEPW